MDLVISHVRIKQPLVRPQHSPIKTSPPINVLPYSRDTGPHQHVVVVGVVKAPSDADLVKIANAARLLGGFLCARENRKQNGGKNHDDGDDDEKFNKGERPVVFLHANLFLRDHRGKLKVELGPKKPLPDHLMLVGDEVTVFALEAGIRAKAFTITAAAQRRNLTGLSPIFQSHHDGKISSSEIRLPLSPPLMRRFPRRWGEGN
jgi:hypothetical protein